CSSDLPFSLAPVTRQPSQPVEGKNLIELVVAAPLNNVVGAISQGCRYTLDQLIDGPLTRVTVSGDLVEQPTLRRERPAKMTSVKEERPTVHQLQRRGNASSPREAHPSTSSYGGEFPCLPDNVHRERYVVPTAVTRPLPSATDDA